MVTAPLVLLAIPSVVIGFVTVGPMLFGGFFWQSIIVDAREASIDGGTGRGVPRCDGHGAARPDLGAVPARGRGRRAAPGSSTCAGPTSRRRWRSASAALYRLLDNKYYLDRFNEVVFAGGARLLGAVLWKGGDVALIDGLAVNGSARVVGWVAAVSRLLQSGYIYHYAFGMIIGLLAMVTLFVTFGR